MLYILLAILLLGVLIMLHEAGHFWAARRCGIEVQEFAVGMGPALWQHRSKLGTLFSWRLFPSGGYCAFYGEDEENEDPRAFNNQKLWKRAVTVACGPLMNLMIAFLVIVIYLSGWGVEELAPIVAAVEPNAAEAGLEVGDKLIAVDGVLTEDPAFISQAIATSNGKSVLLTVERAGASVDVPIVSFYDEAASRWRVGFTFGQVRTRIGLLQSIPFSLRYNAESATLIAKTLRDLVFHGEGVEEVTGPVGTVYVIQEVTRQGGFSMYLELMALISVNLGIVNLLPIPGLDGSRLLFLLVEAMRRKPVKRELEGAIHMAGFALLMGIMLLLTYRDIISIVTGVY